MAKVDFKKTWKHLYLPPKGKFTLIDVPPMNFLMIDGQGDPNASPDFQPAVDAHYAMAFTIKFMLKPQGVDYVVPPLEGLWWMKGAEFDLEAKDQWMWTLMIMQPEWVSREIVNQAREKVAAKKQLPALPRLRFGEYREGLSVQTMYVGPYANEGPTIEQMHQFIRTEGYEAHGKHHEIYLSDPRRTAPEKLRTVIRQPIRPR